MEYNEAKSAIDQSDQIASYQSPLRKYLKWYRKLVIEFLLGTALVNAHFIYNHDADDDDEQSRFQDIEQSSFNDYLEQYDPLPRKYINDMYKDIENKDFDHKYGVRHDKITETFMIGDSKLNIVGSDIYVQGKRYRGTQGLYELLFKKYPNDTVFTDEDKKNYKQIVYKTNAHRRYYKSGEQVDGSKEQDDLIFLREVLGYNPFQQPDLWSVIQEHVYAATRKSFSVKTLKDHLDLLIKIWIEKTKKYKYRSGIEEEYCEKDKLLQEYPNKALFNEEDVDNYRRIVYKTNAHRRHYRPTGQIAVSRLEKYKKIIAPIASNVSNNNSGGSMMTMMEVTNNKKDYIYWDDPNELVDRLRLLVASQDAGHTGHVNEINSLIEELREAKIIESTRIQLWKHLHLQGDCILNVASGTYEHKMLNIPHQFEWLEKKVQYQMGWILRI
nr:unnamed protein product [Callosobruchus chinensis]